MQAYRRSSSDLVVQERLSVNSRDEETIITYTHQQVGRAQAREMSNG